jgi:hypothetical protein
MMTYTSVILLIPLFVPVVKQKIRIISFLLVKITQMLETLFTRLFKIDLINIVTNLLSWGNTNYKPIPVFLLLFIHSLKTPVDSSNRLY